MVTSNFTIPLSMAVSPSVFLGYRALTFGQKCGKREVFLYNLPEVASAREIFGAATVKARFGTSPGIWNAAMVAMAAVVPKDVLLNKSTSGSLATLTAPLVRLVDKVRRQGVCLANSHSPTYSCPDPPLGPGRYYSPRHRMPFNSRSEGPKCV